MTDQLAELKRKKILEAYGNHPTWVAKVQKMPNKQVHAIFTRMLAKGQVKGI